MSLENLVSVIISPEESTDANTHLDALENIVKDKCISLSSTQRREYGKLGNRTENWSNKVLNYMKDQPEFNPGFIDIEEMKRDYEAREALKPILNKLRALTDMVEDTVTLLGTDIYHANTAYYRNIRMLAKQNINGAKSVYEDLATQFAKRSKSSTEE